VHKVARKIRATNEVYHWLAGSVDSKEKFEQHRMELVQHVWKTMKDSDSRECRRQSCRLASGCCVSAWDGSDRSRKSSCMGHEACSRA